MFGEVALGDQHIDDREAFVEAFDAQPSHKILDVEGGGGVVHEKIADLN